VQFKRGEETSLVIWGREIAAFPGRLQRSFYPTFSVKQKPSSLKRRKTQMKINLGSGNEGILPLLNVGAEESPEH
jgi:hypothetical protein